MAARGRGRFPGEVTVFTLICSDLRVAFRSLRRSGWFLPVSVIVLGLGSGAVTAMLSTLYGVVLRPLPFAESERLMWVWSTTDTGRLNSVSAPDYYDYRERCRGFESLAAHFCWLEGRLMTGQAEAERLLSAKVSGNLFRTLGEAPILGRSFVTDEEVLGGPPVVVASHRLWQSRLGGDPEAVGSTVTLDDTSYEVVGVMGESFDYPQGADLWEPMIRGGEAERNRSNHPFWVLGRLTNGVDIEDAQAEIDVVAAQIASTYPEIKSGWGARVEPMQEVFFGDLRQPMLLLTGATVVLLLIGCANLSSLLLARVLGRRSELAVRRALGASPWSISRQVLLESLLVAGLGSAVGLTLAWVALRALRAIGPPDLPRLQSVTLDLPVMLMGLAVTTLAGVLIGLFPAFRGARGELAQQLREGRFTSGAGRSLRLRGLLVGAQNALCLVLLVSAGLLVRSSQRLQQVDPGFQPQGLLTLQLHLPANRYSRQNGGSGQLINDLLGRLRAQHGVTGAALADQVPPFGGSWHGISRADRPVASNADLFRATRRFVSDGYCGTMGIAVLAGRELSPDDREGTPPVMLISQSLAEQLFPGEDPVGQAIVYDGRPHEIVGTVADVKDYGLGRASRPVFYLSMRQHTKYGFKVVLRSAGEPAALTGTVRHVVSDLERDAVVTGVGTMTGWLADSLAGARFSSLLLVTFSGIALFLAAIGLFAVMAFYVAERLPEIGVRMAVGAQPRQIVSWLLAKALVMAGGGLVVGLLASLATGRLIENMLFATPPTDTLTYACVVIVLVTVLLTACLVPARRALGVDLSSVISGE